MEELLRFCHVAAKDKSEYELIDLNYAIYQGEIMVLTGLYGCGKHLIKGLLHGTTPLLHGSIWLNESPVPHPNARICAQKGIYYMDSCLSLVPGISVCDNLFLVRPHSLTNFIYQEKAAVRETRHLLNQYNLLIHPLSKVYELSAFEQFMLHIIKFLSGNAHLFILDMSAFSFRESEYLHLLDLLAKEKANNRSFLLLCSHENPLFNLADQLVILDRGRDVKLLYPGGNTSSSQLHTTLSDQNRTDTNSCYSAPSAPTAVPASSSIPHFVCRINTANAAPLFEAYPGHVIGFYGEEMRTQGMLVNFQNWIDQNQAVLTWDDQIIPCKPPILRYIPENSSSLLFSNLSVEENLLLPRYPRIAGPLGYLSRTMSRCSYSEFVDYIDLDKPINGIAGMDFLTRRLLSIYRFINVSTRIILVENPELGLDPPGLQILMHYIKELSQRGILTIITSNQLPILEEFCTNIVLL